VQKSWINTVGTGRFASIVFDDIEKSELFNKFFCEQSTLDDSDYTSPGLTELQTDGLRQILITETEVEGDNFSIYQDYLF
jgi:hypothetical protein